jgi:hypothetical protein
MRTDEMPKTAISFNVPPKLWEAFKKQADELFLNKAPFLDYMVSRELRELRAELAGLKNSLRAKRHIAGAMKRTDPTSVNIEVRPETADALREATHAHNLVRDAFMSRLILFLRSNDAMLKYREVPRVATSRPGLGLKEMPASPMKAMEAVRDDPLFYVRSHVEQAWKLGIYRVPLPRSIDWAACYLPDESVEGTAAHRRQKKEDAELMALLDDAPAKAPGKKRSVKK